jgi:hypothetical protein
VASGEEMRTHDMARVQPLMRHAHGVLRVDGLRVDDPIARRCPLRDLSRIEIPWTDAEHTYMLKCDRIRTMVHQRGGQRCRKLLCHVFRVKDAPAPPRAHTDPHSSGCMSHGHHLRFRCACGSGGCRRRMMEVVILSLDSLTPMDPPMCLLRPTETHRRTVHHTRVHQRERKAWEVVKGSSVGDGTACCPTGSC